MEQLARPLYIPVIDQQITQDAVVMSAVESAGRSTKVYHRRVLFNTMYILHTLSNPDCLKRSV
jgi:hypothetical protein